MTDIFASLFDSVDSMGPQEFLICVGTALLLGFMISGFYILKNKHTTSFALTIGLLPAIVCVIIMVVSGDIGAGIAVAGAFSLIRFRSAPGSAKEIIVIFLTMAVGLLIGMGFLAYAALFAVIISLVLFAASCLSSSGRLAQSKPDKVLKITIPEDLDYNSQIDDVIAEYTTFSELRSIKSVNMGSMFKLTYNVCLKDPEQQKEFIDKIRVRNGNLEVALLRMEMKETGL